MKVKVKTIEVKLVAGLFYEQTTCFLFSNSKKMLNDLFIGITITCPQLQLNNRRILPET